MKRKQLSWFRSAKEFLAVAVLALLLPGLSSPCRADSRQVGLDDAEGEQTTEDLDSLGHWFRNGEVYGESYALVIGVDRYEDTNISPLGGAVRDAKAVTNMLRAQGFKVRTRLNEQATKKEIMGLLGEKLRKATRADDRVLIYFAGHAESVRGRDDAALGYLLPSDAKRDAIVSTGISMKEIVDLTELYAAKHVMFVADACYSGLALPSARLTRSSSDDLGYDARTMLRVVTANPVRVVMTAGSANQKANEWKGHGLFTYYFLRGLRGAADGNKDGLVTSSELEAYITNNVVRVAEREYRVAQVPQIQHAYGDGKFTFLVNGAGDNDEKTLLYSRHEGAALVYATFFDPRSDYEKAAGGLLWSGLGLAALGGVAFGVAAMYERDKDVSLKAYEDALSPDVKTQAYNDAKASRDKRDTWTTTSITALAVGGGVFAVGLGMLVADVATPNQKEFIQFGFGFGTNEGFATLAGTW